jgi:hypothetical protein
MLNLVRHVAGEIANAVSPFFRSKNYGLIHILSQSGAGAMATAEALGTKN